MSINYNGKEWKVEPRSKLLDLLKSDWIVATHESDNVVTEGVFVFRNGQYQLISTSTRHKNLKQAVEK